MGQRSYCFTAFDLDYENLNFGESFELDATKVIGDEALKVIQYVIFQLEECDETGRWHFQGYMELRKVCRFRAVKKWGGFWETAHLEAREGTRQEAVNYCRKNETSIAGPWTIGAFEAGGQGKRNELGALVEAARGGATARDIALEYPSSYIRYGNGIQRWMDLIRPNPVETITLCRWQRELVGLLRGEPHPRKIRWYVDSIGGSGKSTFVRWYLANTGGAQLLSGGQHQRILYAVEPCRVHFFDFARAMGDGAEAHYPYVPIEHIKNGLVPAGGMYGAGSRVLGPNHCICFSNSMPDESKFSSDRWDIIMLNGTTELEPEMEIEEITNRFL